ncbi:cysteine methyltransferase [Dietzia sp. UCD-THP]|uniref:methylated-DNA--[protein]-cysteine S-methyltransferase n=1 Tax=Dietzia sp. UCD-THP TaxID=1292020 RepID=UPI00037B6467|nr:methylated-DNA--[protein]-cysteine S-methyltransferase [Dietzia sp. UCD-THP]EYT64718.1 cysteine methyltransferase [Dietzia sp. UCD-THP]
MTADDVIDTLRGAPADTDRLRDRLARDAQRGGLVDVLVRSVESPIGELILAATPRGLAYVAFEGESRDEVLQLLATKIGPRVVSASTPGTPSGGTGDADIASVLDDATTQLHDYLAGRRREFTLPLDTVLATGFRGLVQRRLSEVGYGRTATYREIATALDKPGAVRAVGTACATNPLPLVWPCHRILRSDGGLGGYRGGLEVKKRLLAMESAA